MVNQSPLLKKLIHAIAICITTLFISNNANAQPGNNSLKISHLTGDFYIYTTYKNLDDGTPYPSNSMYLVTNKGVVMFDTPWDSTQFQPLLDSIAVKHHQKVVLCIATHFHGDRTAGLEFLQQKGIKTYSSVLTKQLCKTHNDKQAQYVFTNDTTFKVGNYSFETYFPGEGHTKDNIVIWFAKDKILYGSCLVKSTETNSIGNIEDANLKEWPITIKRLINKYPSPAFIIPGHLAYTDTTALTHTLKVLAAQGK